MTDMETKPWKCFEYVCSRFPKCERAVSCCAIDDFYEDVTLSKEQCLDHPEKPYYVEKKVIPRYG